jgi:hypothetical protein
MSNLSESKRRHVYEVISKILQERDDTYSIFNLEAKFIRFCNNFNYLNNMETLNKLLSIKMMSGSSDKKKIVLYSFDNIYFGSKSLQEMMLVLEKFKGREINIIVALGG